MWGKKALTALAFVTLLPLQALAEGPKKIQDNSFLLEEAYNQEPGVVQHIQTFMYLKKSQDWVYSFTQEWPVPRETHQLSYSIPVLHVSDPENSSGIGDVVLNYRYQAVSKEHSAVSPRFSVILPTGDYKKGHGTGSVGLQACIPISVELSDSFVTHWNLGATYTPGSRESGGAKADTTAVNFGASLIYLATENFNLMLEAVGTSGEAVKSDGSKQRADTFFINPGVRFAINFASGLQIVPGFSMPIGIGASAGEFGGLAYLSLEHPLF
jgi:hypothetical protein